MNAKNNLHNALNKAFENHTEPLNEAQWDRLEGAILKRKKRRFFPFFLFFMVICLTAGTTYFLTLNYGLKNNPGISYSSEQKNNPTVNSDLTISENINSQNQTFLEKNNFNATYSKENGSYKKTKVFLTTKTEKEIPETDEKFNETDVSPNSSIPSEENNSEVPVKENTFEEPVASVTKIKDLKLEDLKSNDTVYISQKDDEEKYDVTPVASKFAFTLAGGYSKMNVKVTGIENSEKLHKDTRKIFEESNKNLTTNFINLGFDWNILPQYKIGISTGIQYLRVASIVNIDYTMTEVPFWDYRHTQIIGYSPKTPGLEFKANNTNYTTYITVPVKLNFTVPINKKNEFVISPGINLTGLVSTKGKSVTINKELNNEPGVKPLSTNMYRRLNTGFAGGFQYNTRFKDNWWIGLENILQNSPMKYKTGYGSINNKMQGYMVNLIIKYKI